MNQYFRPKSPPRSFIAVIIVVSEDFATSQPGVHSPNDMIEMI